MKAARIRRKLAVAGAFPSARLTIGRETFDSFYGPLRYFVHTYNHTWRYERCVEVPIARAFIKHNAGPGLEVGNVLSHYGRVEHRIVDRYERRRGLENIDVLDIAGRYGYIISVSTLEHVGIGEPDRDETKALRALSHLRSLLAPMAEMLVSFRLGAHWELTHAVLTESLNATAQTVYAQADGRWHPISLEVARKAFDPAHHDLLWVGILPALV